MVGSVDVFRDPFTLSLLSFSCEFIAPFSTSGRVVSWFSVFRCAISQGRLTGYRLKVSCICRVAGGAGRVGADARGLVRSQADDVPTDRTLPASVARICSRINLGKCWKGSCQEQEKDKYQE